MTIREEVQVEEYKRAYAEGYRQGFRDGLLGGYDMHIYATADLKTENSSEIPTGSPQERSK